MKKNSDSLESQSLDEEKSVGCSKLSIPIYILYLLINIKYLLLKFSQLPVEFVFRASDSHSLQNPVQFVRASYLLLFLDLIAIIICTDSPMHFNLLMLMNVYFYHNFLDYKRIIDR